ncbi:MAG: DNA polymerase IV [Verrucomicrobia bacterium]|nr:DNA polymerase IV [Verrucomicrobiota bacterium]
MSRVILHVDMDAFFASVEQRDHPEWRGRPVIVGSPPDRRGVVAAASYEARKFGVHSAMPSREAGRRCPGGVFVAPRMHQYAEVSRKVFRIFERFTPWIEPLSIDEAFLDVTGAVRIHGSGPEIAAKIRAAIRSELDLTASVGVAGNMFLAKIASDLHKPDGLTLDPDDPADVRAFLAPLPVGRLWGAGQVTEAALTRAGLRTIGDIQRCPPATLATLLGEHRALHLQALAMGLDTRSVETDSEEKSISREQTFDMDCADREAVEAMLVELTDDVGRRLRETGRRATVARIRLRWKSFRTFTRQRRLDPPVCDDFSLRAAARALFAAEPMVEAVRLIGFGVGGLVGEPGSATLFDELPGGLPKRERLSRTMDEINRRYGRGTVRRP